MDLTQILIGLAANVGAPLVKSVLEERFGPTAGQLTDAVVKTIAGNAGVTIEQLPDLAAADPAKVETAIAATETIAPELVGLYTAGLSGQFNLLQTESAEGPLQSGWRWGWMYLLAVFWIWIIIVLPVVNAALEGFGSAVRVGAIESAILMTLTSWFIALYMGGHTLKELGKNAIDAVRTWKAGA